MNREDILSLIEVVFTIIQIQHPNATKEQRDDMLAHARTFVINLSNNYSYGEIVEMARHRWVRGYGAAYTEHHAANTTLNCLGTLTLDKLERCRRCPMVSECIAQTRQQNGVATVQVMPDVHAGISSQELERRRDFLERQRDTIEAYHAFQARFQREQEREQVQRENTARQEAAYTQARREAQVQTNWGEITESIRLNWIKNVDVMLEQNAQPAKPEINQPQEVNGEFMRRLE